MYLKEIREAKGITQQQLADMLGIRRNTVSRYETGDREPDQATLVAIAGALNTTTDYLLTGEQPVISDTSPATIKNAPGQEAEGIQLTELELDTILRYRSAPVEIQKAVDRVLEVDEPPE